MLGLVFSRQSARESISSHPHKRSVAYSVKVGTYKARERMPRDLPCRHLDIRLPRLQNS